MGIEKGPNNNHEFDGEYLDRIDREELGRNKPYFFEEGEGKKSFEERLNMIKKKVKELSYAELQEEEIEVDTRRHDPLFRKEEVDFLNRVHEMLLMEMLSRPKEEQEQGSE